MLKRLAERLNRTLAGNAVQTDDPQQREHAIRMATAVLMVDVARADNDFQEAEFELLIKLIKKQFDLSTEEANQLANAADEKAEAMVEVHQFTKELHNSLSDDEKVRVIDLLWKIAYADGRLSRYEDSLVLKIGDLLYVNRAKVMRLKDDAGQSV